MVRNTLTQHSMFVSVFFRRTSGRRSSFSGGDLSVLRWSPILGSTKEKEKKRTAIL